MSSYSSLFVGKYELNNFIALVDPYTAILFRESDKVVKLKPNKQYRYSSKVEIIKSRLDLLGYSLDKTKQNFNNAKAAMGSFSRKERILINKTNFNDWISAFYQI